MAQRKEEFINNEIYHITSRGVDGREIFAGDEDRWRGIFSLYEFNNTETVTIRRQRQKRKLLKESLKSGRSLAPAELAQIENQIKEDKRDKLVEILSFVFLPNHIHLLLRQVKPSGISVFMQKFGSGYTNFFNAKYKRRGHLFQGKFNASHIGGDEYLKTVFVYIHTNPIAIIDPGWKEKGIKDPAAAIKFLEEYRWSSYPDYIGKKNFPSVTERDLFKKLFGSKQEMKEFVDAWVIHKYNLQH